LSEHLVDTVHSSKKRMKLHIRILSGSKKSLFSSANCILNKCKL